MIPSIPAVYPGEGASVAGNISKHRHRFMRTRDLPDSVPALTGDECCSCWFLYQLCDKVVVADNTICVFCARTYAGAASRQITHYGDRWAAVAGGAADINSELSMLPGDIVRVVGHTIAELAIVS